MFKPTWLCMETKYLLLNGELTVTNNVFLSSTWSATQAWLLPDL